MDISAHVVGLAIEYLDQCAAEKREATLVGMHWYIDGRNKTMPLLEEINQALQQRPTVRIQRVKGAVVFSPNGSDGIVTHEDMRHADKQYRREFSAALKALRSPK